jgi:hypothetical protein
VGIDRPDDADVPSDDHSDHPADRAGPSAADGRQSGRPPAETRSRQEYDADLRAAEAEERAEAGAPSKAAEAGENRQPAKPTATWEEKTEQFRWMWGEYKRRWPPEERPQVDRSKDPPGSWRGDGDRVLERPINERIEAECDRIAQRERETISPALRKVESCDPDRHLVGFEFRLKNRDGIKEKVAKSMAEKGLSAEEATSRVPDAIRFTLEYDEDRYIQGVWADIARMNDQGFKLDILKNSWSSDQYKGINSQWIEPNTGQRFELQFHTRVSFEAKQMTHPAYERLRTHQADAFEELVLEALQKKLTAEVPIPPGAADIPDYPERGRDAR